MYIAMSVFNLKPSRIAKANIMGPSQMPEVSSSFRVFFSYEKQKV